MESEELGDRARPQYIVITIPKKVLIRGISGPEISHSYLGRRQRSLEPLIQSPLDGSA
jgi:hypothetical protein